MQQENRIFTTWQTIRFIMALSLVCAVVLAFLASSLRDTQKEAKELDRAKELLIAAQIFTHDGYFQVRQNGSYSPASYAGKGGLVPSVTKKIATAKEVQEVVKARIIPFLVDNEGKKHTFIQEHIDVDEYVAQNKKQGYANLPLKLVYAILPNPKETTSTTPEGYIIPISGFGLWDYVFGYLAIKPDGNEVIGTAWYDQKETPGLGGVIAEAGWQKLFPGKKIFQEDAAGTIDMQRSSLGLVVVKGKVKDVYGDTPRSHSAIDGISGATLTGNGVTKAYKNSLIPYRPFFIRLHEENKCQK